jgi:hypothetical protein
MSANEFPSGPWTGWFTYSHSSGRWRTDLILTFENGRMTGEGNDSVGPFVIAGAYDPVSKECYWMKTYVAAHDVFYKGFREGKGIWGTWEIGNRWRGGFQIWPVGADGGEEESEWPEEKVLAEPVRVGTEMEVSPRGPFRVSCGHDIAAGSRGLWENRQL